MPTKQEINDALVITGAYNDLDQYDRGWNAGVQDVTSGQHSRVVSEPDMYDDPPWYVGGFYCILYDDGYYGNQPEFYEGWNAGKEAALKMKNGTAKPVSEKTPEEIQYERRMKCFTMAEKYAPGQAIRGGEKEPVGETINRAEVLYNYFYNGERPVVETAVKKAK